MAQQIVQEKWPFVINLGNSIIGVALLAMPFCFKQCGILLGTLVLLFCTWLTLASCQMLMKAGVVSHHQSYEYLAYHTYGAPGKFLVELGMIGIQLGTLVAQIVVIGDLGPAIFSDIFGVKSTPVFRLYLIVFLCLFVGLPLGLMKDMRNVNRASTICIVFYAIFCVYIVWMSLDSILSTQWYSHVSWWEPTGLFQCLPIMSFCFGCQTQLFHLYDALPEPSLHAIKSIIHTAVNLCTVAYLVVGFFGYVTFYHTEIPGDILTKFPTALGTHVMKLGFVMSIAITFPVIIFPCRASIYTMIFQKDFFDRLASVVDSSTKVKHSDDVAKTYIPEVLFKGITVFIVISSMITGILIPNVEFILGINGAITGTLICYIFPALFFLRVISSNAEGKTIAQIVLFLGVVILLVSTYSTLSAQDKAHLHGIDKLVGKDDPANIQKPVMKEIEKDFEEAQHVEPPSPHDPDSLLKQKTSASEVNKGDMAGSAVGKEVRKEKDSAEAEGQQVNAEAEIKKRQDELLGALERQREEQQQVLQQQKEILQELREHKEKDHEGWLVGQKQQNLKDTNNERVEQQAAGVVQPLDTAKDTDTVQADNLLYAAVREKKEAIKPPEQFVGDLGLGQNSALELKNSSENQKKLSDSLMDQKPPPHNPLPSQTGNISQNLPADNVNLDQKEVLNGKVTGQIMLVKNQVQNLQPSDDNKEKQLVDFGELNQAPRNPFVEPYQSENNSDRGKRSLSAAQEQVEEKQKTVQQIINSDKKETLQQGQNEQDKQQVTSGIVLKSDMKEKEENENKQIKSSEQDLLQSKKSDSDLSNQPRTVQSELSDYSEILLKDKHAEEMRKLKSISGEEKMSTEGDVLYVGAFTGSKIVSHINHGVIIRSLKSKKV